MGSRDPTCQVEKRERDASKKLRMTSDSFRRRAGYAFLTLFISALCLSRAWGADSVYRFAPAGGWVLSAKPDYDAPEPTGETSNGSWLLALDRQINVTASGDDSYEYVAVRVSSAAGIEEESQINLKVDPAYQSIDIHFLRLRRGATSIDARPGARITALPQETQVRERIYNGGYNVNVLLADVRPGDVIEYAYTTHSRELMFPGHYAASLTVGWSTPVHWQRVRVRAPLGRPMRAQLSDGSAAPEFIARGAAREFLMEWRDLLSIPGEDNRPTWNSPWPRLYLSDFKDWAEVSHVVDPLFASALRTTAPVAAVAREIAATRESPEQMTLRALQYVQDQVYYVSIAIGRGGYQPAEPDTVLQRRYGDCKDKSVLLVALLAQLHISAQPALVNSRRGRILTDMLPTPFAFDHAIVRVQVGEKTYWVDGTSVKQYTPLSVDAPPDFENALLLGSASDRLVSIPRPASGSRRKEVSVTVDLRDGLDKPGKLSVVTRYLNSMADDMRVRIARQSLERRRADYLDYTTRYYAGAKSAGPLRILDDKARDILELRELYTLDPAFRDGKMTLHADELYGYSETISTTERRAPLALDYPIFVRQKITALMPEEWPVHVEKVRVGNPAFRYQSEVSYSDRKVELTYEYEALKDEVAPAALQKYLADRRAFDDDVGFVLNRNNKLKTEVTARKQGSGALLFFTFLFATAFAAWALPLIYRWNSAPQAPLAGASRGIAGWLLLPAIGAVAAPMTTAIMLLPTVLSPHAGSSLAVPTQVALAAATAILFVAQLSLIRPFFTRRASVPTIYIAVAWLAVACATAVNASRVSEVNPAAGTEFALGFGLRRSAMELALAVIWTLYLRRSQRVRATFQELGPQTPPGAGVLL